MDAEEARKRTARALAPDGVVGKQLSAMTEQIRAAADQGHRSVIIPKNRIQLSPPQETAVLQILHKQGYDVSHQASDQRGETEDAYIIKW